MLDDISVNTLQVFGWLGENIFVFVQKSYEFIFFFGGKMSPYCDYSVGLVIQVHFLGFTISGYFDFLSLSRLASM
jgi:hypothetical protein